MQNKEKIEQIIQIYLTPLLLDLLGNDTKNLLYCSKNITIRLIYILKIKK